MGQDLLEIPRSCCGTETSWEEMAGDELHSRLSLSLPECTTYVEFNDFKCTFSSGISQLAMVPCLLGCCHTVVRKLSASTTRAEAVASGQATSDACSNDADDLVMEHPKVFVGAISELYKPTFIYIYTCSGKFNQLTR